MGEIAEHKDSEGELMRALVGWEPNHINENTGENL